MHCIKVRQSMFYKSKDLLPLFSYCEGEGAVIPNLDLAIGVDLPPLQAQIAHDCCVGVRPVLAFTRPSTDSHSCATASCRGCKAHSARSLLLGVPFSSLGARTGRGGLGRKAFFVQGAWVQPRAPPARARPPPGGACRSGRPPGARAPASASLPSGRPSHRG